MFVCQEKQPMAASAPAHSSDTPDLSMVGMVWEVQGLLDKPGREAQAGKITGVNSPIP